MLTIALQPYNFGDSLFNQNIVGIPYFWISRQNPYSTWEEIIWMVAQHAPNEVVTIEVVAA